jgi:hypothetical protein
VRFLLSGGSWAVDWYGVLCDPAAKESQAKCRCRLGSSGHLLRREKAGKRSQEMHAWVKLTGNCLISHSMYVISFGCPHLTCVDVIGYLSGSSGAAVRSRWAT